MTESNKPKDQDILMELEDVHMFFGKVCALAGVSLKVRKGEIHSVIGPNGAGKTVMMNIINGLYSPQNGNIFYKQRKINTLKPISSVELS